MKVVIPEVTVQDGWELEHTHKPLLVMVKLAVTYHKITLFCIIFLLRQWFHCYCGEVNPKALAIDWQQHCQPDTLDKPFFHGD